MCSVILAFCSSKWYIPPHLHLPQPTCFQHFLFFFDFQQFVSVASRYLCVFKIFVCSFFSCYIVMSGILRLVFLAAAKLSQSRLTLCDPTDGSPTGSSVPGILQARIWEWVAISFSIAWKWSRSVVSDS